MPEKVIESIGILPDSGAHIARLGLKSYSHC